MDCEVEVNKNVAEVACNIALRNGIATTGLESSCWHGPFLKRRRPRPCGPSASSFGNAEKGKGPGPVVHLRV